MTEPASAQAETAESLRAGRELLIKHFRVNGELNAGMASSLMTRAMAFVRSATGEQQAFGLYELATLQRFVQQWDAALATYATGVARATQLGLTNLAFDGELGIAMCHAYGTKNHGEAARAVARGAELAGARPTRKQQYKLSSFQAEMSEGWGDLDVALISGQKALSMAETDEDRYFAELELGSVLQGYANSCDYRPLIDAKSSSDADNVYGACFRAVAAARGHYTSARELASRLGWQHLTREMTGFLTRLDQRAALLAGKAQQEAALAKGQLFEATRRKDVIVNDDFAGGADAIGQQNVLAGMIDYVVSSGGVSSRSLYLQGLKADLDRQPSVALDFYKRSVEMLNRERASLFDVRGRSTVIENRIEHVRDLGLRLLAMRDFEGGFQAFESIRAQGMSVLASALAQKQLKLQAREWISRLIYLDSKASATIRGLVDTTIAGMTHSQAAAELALLEQTQRERDALLARPEVKQAVDAVKRASPKLPTLAELQQLARSSKSVVVLYWCTTVNVILFTISADGAEARTVFLPETELNAKVQRVLASMDEGRPFDVKSARELYTYLIAPVRDRYTGSHFTIVPQGALVQLPFEALIDPDSGKYLIEDATVSYAPNAFFASRALRAQPWQPSPVRAVYDQSIEDESGEIASIQTRLQGKLVATNTTGLTSKTAMDALSGARNLHVLMHGKFASDDALSSRLYVRNPTIDASAPRLSASELLAVDWSATQLVTFSACESAVLNPRISNEVYGLPWAPLVSGVPRVLLSRWVANMQSNAQWMATFFGALAADHKSVSSASAEATRSLIATPQFRHPYFWAAPQLFGI